MDSSNSDQKRALLDAMVDACKHNLRYLNSMLSVQTYAQTYKFAVSRELIRKRMVKITDVVRRWATPDGEKSSMACIFLVEDGSWLVAYTNASHFMRGNSSDWVISVAETAEEILENLPGHPEDLVERLARRLVEKYEVSVTKKTTVLETHRQTSERLKELFEQKS